MEYIKSLEEVMEAASIIHHVASNSWKRHDAPDCPHGNFPAYPSHGVWCDDCFNRLQFAIDAAEIERNSLPTTHAPDLADCEPELVSSNAEYHIENNIKKTPPSG